MIWIFFPNFAHLKGLCETIIQKKDITNTDEKENSIQSRVSRYVAVVW